MRLIFLILLFFLSTSVKSQIIQSSCVASDSIIEIYKEDATLLTLRRIYLNGDSHKDSVIIPENYIDTVLNAMIAVYNATSIPERDTVIDVFGIIPFYNYGLHMFSLGADSGLVWMNQLEIGNLNTGFTELDNIITNYNFTQYGYYDWPWWYHSSTFVSNETYNVKALIEPLNLSQQVYYADPDFQIFDGPDMLHIIHSNYVEMRYMRRWGDCPSGCMYQRTWVFNVYFDCSVEFVESYDGPSPDASVTDINLEHVIVGPNPSKGIITIKGIEGKYDYDIVDNLGKVIVSSINNESETIDLTSLPNGTYILQIMKGDTNLTRKIIKL